MGQRWTKWYPRHWRKRRRRFPTAWQPSGVERLNPKIEQLKAQVELASDEKKHFLLERLLVLQTPRAVLAQNQMDIHPRGYHDKQKRLYELIDFNDTFVDCVLSLSPEGRAGFTKRIKAIMAKFCAAENVPMFSDQQFDAIVHGLSREIAVYLGVQREGFTASMTSRAEDAFGIDMVISDPRTGRSLNVDIKTPSAFRYRLEELEKEGRITSEQLLRGDEDDFVTVINRHDRQKVPVTIVCIRPEDVGDVVDFELENTVRLGELLRRAMTTVDETDKIV